MKLLNRAKSIYSDEYFISEDIRFEDEDRMMYLRVNGIWRECEESTRSIHLEDMLDSQGNKIFASLNKVTGEGGDIVNKTTKNDSKDCIAKFSSIGAGLDTGKFIIPMCRSLTLKVIGIQE